MKKFSLKPLGDSCMKTLCKSWLFIGLLMAFCLAACSDDDDNAETPIFPEKQNLICNSNDTREFTFTANTNWSLASSAIWCKFKTDDEEEFVLSGTAGTQTVTLVITDENMQVGNVSVAKLELTMGGQTIVIGEVTRSKVDYKLKIYDKEGNDITEDGVLKVGYQEYLRFDVEANFRFAATNLPGWVELEGGSLVGAVNKKVQGGLRIIENESREKYPVSASDENVITFSDEEGRAFHTIRLAYEGMTPGKMELKRPSSYATDWVVSMDGKTFTQKSTGGSTGEVVVKKRMPFTVKTLKDDFEIVFLSKGWDDNIHLKGSMYDFFTYEWIHYEKDGGNLNLIVDDYIPNTMNGDPDERSGYVLAFSRADYEKIKDNLEEAIVVNGEIDYKYEQNNLLIGFTQKEVKEEGGSQSFKIKKMGYLDVTPTKTTDTSILNLLEGNYNIDGNNVYSISASAGDPFVIHPLLSESEWTGAAYVINSSDEEVNVEIETSMDGEGMYFGITVPNVFNDDLIIVFKGTDNVFKKALVISPDIN